MNIMYRLVSYSRTRPSVVALGIFALTDKSRIVRYHACAALAYSLQLSALIPLQELLSHPDKETRQDAAAAIDAIQSKNHHYFADRNHSEKVFWHPGKYKFNDA
jgi:HEAT repeat protein